MITIYSVSAGKLFTDPKQRAYIDSDLLREKAVAVRTQAVLDRIAETLGFRSFDGLSTYARCTGITENILMQWIISGKIADSLNRLNN